MLDNSFYLLSGETRVIEFDNLDQGMYRICKWFIAVWQIVLRIQQSGVVSTF